MLPRSNGIGFKRVEPILEVPDKNFNLKSSALIIAAFELALRGNDCYIKYSITLLNFQQLPFKDV